MAWRHPFRSAEPTLDPSGGPGKASIGAHGRSDTRQTEGSTSHTTPADVTFGGTYRQSGHCPIRVEATGSRSHGLDRSDSYR